ncbi:MAG: hypothetical protein ACK55Z_31510, partial [bacterium]
MLSRTLQREGPTQGTHRHDTHLGFSERLLSQLSWAKLLAHHIAMRLDLLTHDDFILLHKMLHALHGHQNLFDDSAFIMLGHLFDDLIRLRTSLDRQAGYLCGLNARSRATARASRRRCCRRQCLERARAFEASRARAASSGPRNPSAQNGRRRQALGRSGAARRGERGGDGRGGGSRREAPLVVHGHTPMRTGPQRSQ